MVRQARRYLAGAASSAALIAVAIVAFVLLVSAEAFRQWPIAGLGSNDAPAVSPARAVEEAASVRPRPPAARKARHRHAASTGHAARSGGGDGPRARVVADVPGTLAGSTASEGSGGGGAKPSPPAKHAGGPVQAEPAPSGGSSGGGSAGSGSSGSSGRGTQNVSGTVAEAVNGTVSQVDTATEGALEQAGVTPAAEETVESVAGPESVVGQTVDKTVQGVDGLIAGGR